MGALSTNLDNNITGSLTTVFSDPTFSQSVIGGDLTYTLTFDFSSNPFVYDPTTGDNLLMDIVIANKPGGWAFYRGNGQGITSRATSSFADDVGLRTLIETQPTTIPEPSSLVLFGIGVCVMGIGAARRRREKNESAEA